MAHKIKLTVLIVCDDIIAIKEQIAAALERIDGAEAAMVPDVRYQQGQISRRRTRPAASRDPERQNLFSHASLRGGAHGKKDDGHIYTMRARAYLGGALKELTFRGGAEKWEGGYWWSTTSSADGRWNAGGRR